MSAPLTEHQALGLSDVAHGAGVDLMHQRTQHSLRGKGLIFQREDRTWGLTDRGHDAFAEVTRRWPVLLDHDYRTPTHVPEEGSNG